MGVTRRAGIVLVVLVAGSAAGTVSRAQAPAVGPLPAADPVLAPGDAVRVTVWRHPEFSGDFTVGRDSSVVHPLYQTVKIGGVPLSVARDRLRVLLTSYEQGVQLSLEPLWPVTVVGEVRAPNLYRLPHGTTVAQAVALAGGPTERGRLDHVRVIRPRGALVLDLLADYQRTQPVVVAAGDQVVVDRRSQFSVVRDLLVPLASVTGAVAAIISVSRQR
jgi:polysaccharide export outer membrane protein